MKISPLVATTALVLAAVANTAHAAHKPYTMLWNQYADLNGFYVNSQNYEQDMYTYDDEMAGEFTVPTGQRWLVSEVDVPGEYINGPGQAGQEVVAFYKTGKKGGPGKPVKNAAFTLNCADTSGSFQCNLPIKTNGRPVLSLRSGTYWVGVVANCNSQTCGQWMWEETSDVVSVPAQWENSYGGWNSPCRFWGNVGTCYGGSTNVGAAFDIIGTQD